MDLRSPRPFWVHEAETRHRFAPLGEDLETDVAVVGAGITGALVAYEFARRGHDVVVVDGRDPAMGSTAASTALLLYEVDPGFAGVARHLGMKAAEDTYLELERAIHEMGRLSKRVEAGDYTPRPCLYLASRRQHVNGLRKEFTHRRRIGLDIEWLDAPSVRREYNATKAAAIRSHGQAHINPFDFTRQLLRSSRRIQVYGKTQVTHADYSTGVELATAKGTRLWAKQVVYATGYETSLHPATFRAKKSSTYAIASQKGVPLWPDYAMFWETDRPYYYGRCTADSRLMAGGFNDPYRSARKRDARIGARANDIQAFCNRVFPKTGVQVDHAWAGTFAETHDGLPYVGADPRHPNAFFLLGYGANGSVFAQVGAKLLADMVEGVTNSFRAFRPGPNRRHGLG